MLVRAGSLQALTLIVCYATTHLNEQLGENLDCALVVQQHRGGGLGVQLSVSVVLILTMSIMSKEAFDEHGLSKLNKGTYTC